jgi:proteasome lid subunit RPN8/RPN11
MFQIEGKVETSLKMLMADALPNEVGGIIVREKEVHVLYNHSEHPHNQFLFYLSELKTAVLHFKVPLDRMNDDVVIWHTHPGGLVGPSREDMQNRTPLKHHLVLTNVDGDMVATWY